MDSGGIAERAGLCMGMTIVRVADEPETVSAQVGRLKEQFAAKKG